MEVLKGPSELKDIKFRHPSNARFAPGAAKIVSGEDYLAFLCWISGGYWVFEGPAGLRPLAPEYRETHLEANGKPLVDIFSHSNYLNTIRRLAAVSKVSISELLAHQEQYLGKRVEVTGYYISSFEHSGLYESKEVSHRYRDGSKPLGVIHNGLWIMPFAKPGYESKMSPAREGFVRVIGLFSYNSDRTLGVGHLNGWPAELSALELFEAAP